MTAALVVSGVLLAFFVVLPAVRSTGVLPVWRIRRAPTISPQHEAERARILATPVEELAEEIARERERAQPGYLEPSIYTEMARLAIERLKLAAAQQYSDNERIARARERAHQIYRGPPRCLLDACRGSMFSSPTTKQSICGHCGRVVGWEEARS